MMIAKFVEAWEAKKETVRDAFKRELPSDYEALVKAVVTMLGEALENEYAPPDPSRIHRVDDGDYQGTLVFVVGAAGYQPSRYWYVRISYGSCSGCDTLESIRDYSDEVTDEKLDQYMTLALHVVQKLKEMDDAE